MELIRKDLDFEIKAVGDPADRTLEFIGSTAHVDRYGDVIEVEGWDIKHYKKNPVFLWAHDYRQPPVGKAVQVDKTDQGLLFRIKFPTVEEYPFADTIYKLYLGGYLQATSVGFQDLEREPINEKEGKQTGWRYKKQELYELSAVPVPANPNALIMAVQKGVVSSREVEDLTGVLFEENLIQAMATTSPEDVETKGVIPFKSYPADPEDGSWDGPAEVKTAEVNDLKVMCTWFDSENPAIKSSYKLPHHRAEGYHTVWRGVSAAMAALLGARGGVNLPEEDHQGVYNHLAKHYNQFDKEPPEFKAYGEADLAMIEIGLPPLLDKHLGPSAPVKRMVENLYGQNKETGLSSLILQVIKAVYGWLMGNEDLNLPAPVLQILKVLYGWVVETLTQDSLQALAEGDLELKAGAVLNTKNKAALKQAQALIQQVLDSAEASLPEEGDGKGSAPGQLAGKNIYSLALNPGFEPEGERPAGEPDFSQLLSSTQRLHQQVRGGK